MLGLKFERVSMGLTQQEFARLLKVKQPHLSEIEAGKRIPKDKFWNNASIVLSIPVEELKTDRTV